jgi:hypothetical protein
MQTWLDFYIAGALDKIVGTPAKSLLRRHTDVDAMHIMAMSTLMSAANEPDNGSPDTNRHHSDETTVVFFGMIMAFCTDYSDPGVRATLEGAPGLLHSGITRSPRGVQVDRDLITSFAHAKSPETMAWQPPLLEHTWYFDLPHRTVMLDDETEIRAIFTQPTADSQAAAAVAVLCQPGSDQMSGRFAWMIQPDGTPTEVRGDAMGGIDGESVREQATDLVKLLLLYRQMAENVEAGELPHVSADQMAKLKRKKARARQKTHTLFRVVRLRAPRDRFVRVGETSGETDGETGGQVWTLGHRVAVRGHFRWQPYGEQRRKQRLRWIEPHLRGPEDGDRKVDMEVLKT